MGVDGEHGPLVGRAAPPAGTRRRAAVLGLALAAAASAAPAGAACRQALALGLDVSGSVDGAEYRLQMDGLAGALTSPDVVEAMTGTPGDTVALAIFEWSGPEDASEVLPWTDVAGPADLAGIAARLRAAARAPGDPSTAIGSAMGHGFGLLAGRPDCARRTLDLSGDGKANTGPRAQSVEAPPGIVVNALAIGSDAPTTGDERQVQIAELTAYFRAEVIRGPDAFVEAALGFEDYEEAMRRKLLRELLDLAVAAAPAPR